MLLRRRLYGAALLLGSGLLAASAPAQPPAALPPSAPPRTQPADDVTPVPPLPAPAKTPARPVIATSRPLPHAEPSPLPVPSDGLDGLPRPAAAPAVNRASEPGPLALPSTPPLEVRPAAERPTPVRPAAYHPDAEMPPAPNPAGVRPPGPTPPPIQPPPADPDMLPPAAADPGTPARPAGGNVSVVSLEVTGPTAVAPGEPLAYEIIARNPGPFVAAAVRVEQRLPAGARLVESAPVAETQGDRLAWDLGNLAAGAERRVKVEVRPAGGGEVVVAPSVSYTAPVALRTRVVEPAFAASVAVPDHAMRGGAVPLQVKVANHSGRPVDHVVVTVKLPPGLRYPAGAAVEAEVGTLGAGEERALPLDPAAAAVGRQVVEVEARADGALHARARAAVVVAEAALALRLDGPASGTAGREADLSLEVKNPALDPAKDLCLSVTVPEGLEVLSASDGGVFHRLARTLSWRLDGLAAGRTQRVVVRVKPHQPGDWTVHAGALADGMAEAQASHSVKVAAAVRPGTPLRVEVVNPHDTLEVGAETTYEVRVHNQGADAHADVRLTADVPVGLALVRADGPVRHRVLEPERPAGGGFLPPPPGVEFEPLPELRPREVAVYRVRVRGRQPGACRVRFQLSADGQPYPAPAEASTRVVDGAHAAAAGRGNGK